ncbi:2-hydroxyisoflavanone dehydratase [Thalictrum thalictroides]|uniref:2-hydroxyisoflavanone dehydratase n=1 Tax=Thalictrum thalictroides TaxID=46969 RepID=A0A7J6X2Y8_THATH|nr:2-hydroxyisoflavanone dehydratase [Thalictrum thalictroides]
MHDKSIILGGTFALYSNICRYAKISLIPNQQAEDRELSNYRLDIPSNQLRRAQQIKEKLENCHVAKLVLLLITILGGSLVIGDGILTPCISGHKSDEIVFLTVLSAVSGIKRSADFLNQGTEAMFADLGHFSVQSVQVWLIMIRKEHLTGFSKVVSMVPEKAEWSADSDTDTSEVAKVHCSPGHCNKLISVSVDGLMCTFDTEGNFNDDDHLESVEELLISSVKFSIFYSNNIRGLALGIALGVYGREEEADTLIRDQDPIILRYGGIYGMTLAYWGSANNKAIHQLLHFVVSDVSKTEDLYTSLKRWEYLVNCTPNPAEGGHIWLKSLHSENTYDATELSPSLVVIENDWISPPSGYLKINFDVGYDKISGNAYVVPICRDIDEVVQVCAYSKFKAVQDAEYRAVVVAVKLIASFDLNKKAQVAYEVLPYLRVYQDGHVERLSETDKVPPGFDSKTSVTSKDSLIIPNQHVSARIYLPKVTNTNNKLPVLVYYHGGAFCLSSPSSPTYHNCLNSLVSKANVIAVSVNFRLAPEHRLPIAYEDSWGALQWVASHSKGQGSESWLAKYADFSKLFLAGDSSGANIAHNIAMLAGDPKAGLNVKILGIALIHPYFWGSKRIGSESTSKPFMEKVVVTHWPFVCPSSPSNDDPRVNPVGDGAPNLSCLGCTKVLVCVAGKDVFKDRGRLYYDTLSKCGWNGVVEIFETEGEGHAFHLHKPTSQEAKDLNERLAAFLRLENCPLSCL